MNFKSDNVAHVHPAIMEAIISSNQGSQSSYGNDDYSHALQKSLSEIFEKEVAIYLTNTGTAANSLALATLAHPYETIFCSEQAHIYSDECSAPELYSGGARILPLKSMQGKIDANEIEKTALHLLSHRPHSQKPGCVSVTQATECGTIYTPDELKAIASICKKYLLPLHMDGARFANSLATLGLSPAQATWQAGVDVMSFGATKNGALCAEAIIFFNQEYAQNFDYLHKRAGQLMSKTRFFAAQFLSYVDNNIWLDSALHANKMAQELVFLFNKANIEIIYPVQANELFVHLSLEQAQALEKKGCGFYSWGMPGERLYRFVTSWATSLSDIEAFSKALLSLRP